jgi:hypothetical protein
MSKEDRRRKINRGKMEGPMGRRKGGRKIKGRK